MCAHVIEDQSPGPPQTKSTLPSLPTAPSISPIKRKAKGIKDEVSEKISAPSDEKKKDKNKASDKGLCLSMTCCSVGNKTKDSLSTKTLTPMSVLQCDFAMLNCLS